jgi:hypothetical protein
VAPEYALMTKLYWMMHPVNHVRIENQPADKSIDTVGDLFYLACDGMQGPIDQYAPILRDVTR